MLAVFGVAAVVSWLIVSKTLAAYLATEAPRVALWLNPAEPAALTQLASLRLAELTALSRKGGSAGSDTLQPGAGAKQQGASQQAQADRSRSEASAALESDVHQLAEMQRRSEFARGLKSSPPPAETSEADAKPPATAEEKAQIADEVRALCARAIAAVPLDPRPFRILAELAMETGDTDQAGAFFKAAAARSRHEPMAYYDMVLRAQAAGDYATALKHTDTILRSTPGAMEAMAPVIVGMAENKEAAPLVKALLASSPPWRNTFFAAALPSITDARTPLQLLLALKGTANPPTTLELKNYLDFLIRRDFTELAYYTWLQFLPPEQLAGTGLLYNADLRTPPSGLPFDWAIAAGRGVTVDFQRLSEGEHALLLDFAGGRVDLQGVTQRVLLSPGSYVLSGRHKGDVAGRRGLKWRVVCTPGNESLGESSMILGRQQSWKEFSVSFTVPEQGCGSQIVRLDLDARSASETIVSGTIRFTGLNLSRQVAAAPPAVPAGR